MAPLLREIVRDAIVREPDLDIVAEHDGIDVRAAVELDDPDFIIVGEDAAAHEDVRQVVGAASRLRALEVQSDGRESVLYELRPHRIPLGEISSDTLVRDDPGGADVGREDVRTKRANGGSADATNTHLSRRLHRGGPERRPADHRRRHVDHRVRRTRAARPRRRRRSTITSYGDFERIFGGLWLDSNLGYAVQDFYRNGGSTAIVVRVHKTKANDTAVDHARAAARAQLDLVAASPGAWGSKLTATIDDDVSDTADTTLFNLTVTDTGDREDRGRSATSRSRRRARGASTSCSQPSRRSCASPGDAADSAAVRRSRSRRRRRTATTATPIDAERDHDGRRTSAPTSKGSTRSRTPTSFNLVVIPPYTTAGEIEATGARGHDLVRRGEARGHDHGSAGRVVEPRQRRHRRVGRRLHEQQERRHLLPADQRARRAARRPAHARSRPSGAIAGVIARTDATRGVWKAPAGLDATLSGVAALSVPLTDPEIGQLNPLGVNCLRASPGAGHTVWGARTRAGSDRLASEWKYLPVRRTALFLEESLFRGTQWVVFEPNDAPLWAQIRLNVGAFMNNLFRQGAFAGTTPREAYFVKCDAETTTQDDVNLGIVNIVVGFAPLKPAEFVVIQLQQLAGQTGSA